MFLFACNAVQAGSPISTQVIDTTLDDDPTSITGAWNTGNLSRVAFYVVYDETDSGTVVSIAITAHISSDNSNWISMDWYDIAGGTTKVTSETMSADGSYVGWFDPDIQIPYVRLTVTATGSTATELADVDAYIVGLQ